MATSIKTQDATERLRELEKTLENAITLAFVTAGKTLREIRNCRLYRVKGFATFEEYCRVRWKMSRIHAHRLIDSSVVNEILLPIGNILPANEAVSRELVPLKDPTTITEVWEEAVSTAPIENGQPIVTAKHVKTVVTKYRHSQIDDAPSFPKGTYRILYADPPWKYSDKLVEGYGAAEHHYPQMSITELCDMVDGNGKSIAKLLRPDAVLFMWVTSPMLEVSFQVIKAWGFKYKTSFIWDKIKHNYGHYNSVRHEFLLICTKGSCTPDVAELHDSVVSVERGKHSEKPEEFREIIDTLYPARSGVCDRIELFARKECQGWISWGNE